MAYTQLTVFDEREKCVATVSGTTWIFHTLTQDPRTLEQFVEAEIALSGFSSLRDDDHSRLYSKPWSREGTTRSPDNGGTVIINLPKRIVTVKAHLETEAMYAQCDDKDRAVQQGKKVVDQETGERFYDTYGLLSRLREGIVGYSVTIKQERKPKRWFQSHSKVYQEVSRKFPKSPTKEDPDIYWTPSEIDLTRNSYLTANLVKEWEAPYKLPDSWAIVDGILHKKY